jgi:hypothetical protein
MKTNTAKTTVRPSREIPQIVERTTPAAVPDAVPEWVNKTWPDHFYAMTIFESSDGSVEEIKCTRAEYISLKHHLAVLRGYVADGQA